MSAETALAAEPPAPDQGASFTYDAFLSYSHQDGAVAAGIQKGLHRIGRRVGRLNALRVFRDTTDLAANPDLWGKVTGAMDLSRYLIVVLSPRAAASEWVNREVAHWLHRRGLEQLLIVVAEGHLHWDESAGRFNPDRSDAALPVLTEPGVKNQLTAGKLCRTAVLDGSIRRGTGRCRHHRSACYNAGGPTIGGSVSPGEPGTSIDELLDRAVAAVNRGDHATAATLAGHVLAVDRGNKEAEDLLSAPSGAGEIRRLSILFADVVDSTLLSTQVEPETYRTLIGRYRDLVVTVVDRYEGHVASVKGDGLLAVFGYPKAHENDVRRAVLAALEISREVGSLGEQALWRFGVRIAARVGVHRGTVYLDTAQDDVYGTAANLAQRVSSLAPAGSVAVSDAVAALVSRAFELQPQPPAPVKGFDVPIRYHLALAERPDAARLGVGRGPLVGRDRELARLYKSWQRARAGTLQRLACCFVGSPASGNRA